MKAFRPVLAALLVLCLLFSMFPAYAFEAVPESEPVRGVHNYIQIDDDAAGGYEGDYVVIYNPSTSTSGVSTGNMTGLIETSVGSGAAANPTRSMDPEKPFYKIDVDSQLAEYAQTAKPGPEPEPVKVSFNVGSTRNFTLLNVQTNRTYSLQFECLYVGEHCYIWTPTSTTGTYYPLDEIDPTFAELAANEFDSKFDLMQSSFGNHTNGSQGDGKLHMLYYNIDEGWNGSGGYIAGFFYQGDISSNGLPILNIDTYPGVYYQNPNSGNIYKRMDDTYNTMVHEYQHLINYSNTNGMASWLNECFSAAAEEICYPGSSVVDRIQSWENYYYSTNNDWLNPPTEFAYNPTECPNLHQGYSLYSWSNDITDVLALYGQVSLFAQYLFTRFGNSIYRQISNKYSSSGSNREVNAISNGTGVACSDLARDFRIALTANAAQNMGFDQYGFREQANYDPAQFYNVMNPYSLLSPVVFTGSSCSIKGGGAITVKPVNGVYNPPSGANSNLKYFGIKLAVPYTVTAVSNNEAWGTVSVSGTTITASPADGYYVAGYEVVEGTATAVINGNTISVTPSSDCTIRILFAEKPTYTVNFVASGAAEGSQSALVNDSITLPSAVSVTASGWTFSGWVTSQFDETTVAPEIFAPGASYTVIGDVTLYAVYTRVEEGTGDLYYELLSEAPADWAGNYVITYLTTTSMYLMKGVAPSSNGAQIESTANASAYAASGVTLSDNKLTGVTDPYVFTLAPHGGYYSIQSVSTGTYLGMDSSSYMAGYTAYVSTTCDWTPGVKADCSTASNATNGSYPLISFNTTNRYFWSGNPNNDYAPSVRWWKEANGSTTYYWTDPVAAENKLVDVYVVDELDGQSVYAWAYGSAGNLDAAWPGHAMTSAGTDKGGHPFYLEEDLNVTSYGTLILNRNGQPQSAALNVAQDAGENDYVIYYVYGVNGNDLQVSKGDDIWPAPGVVTEPTCLDAGFTTYTGMFTGETRTGNEVPALGHDYTAVVTEATCTTGGYTTYTCSRCGDTYVGNEVEPLGHDYVAVVTEATCTEGGLTTYTCSRCGDTYTGNETDPLGHDYVAVVTEPTCLEGGYTTYTCSRCGDSYVGDETDPLGHDYVAVVTEPTCLEGGFTTYTCSRCGDSYTADETQALGHLPREAVQENVVPATYEAAGSYDSVVYCQRCGAELSRETVEIPMLVAELENGYYLIGPDWSVDAIDPANLFAPNPDTEGEFQLVKTLAVGDQIKVVHVTNDSIDGWFPQGTGNQYTVDEEHAGNVVVYFRPTYQDAWASFGGYIWIGANETPSEPIETSALHIYSSISVGTDMIITLTIRKNDLTNYEKFWIEVVKHEPVNGDVTYVYEQDVLTENSATWTYQFNKIYAKEMGLDVDARLYAQDAAGQVYMSPARNANIREHLGGRLTATNNIVEQRVLAADMLNYGAAAQRFMDYQTNHLVNEELTDEQLEKLHEYETKELPAADKTNSNTLPEGQSNILFNSMTLGNEVLLNLTVQLPENTGNVQVQVKEHASGDYVKTLDAAWSGSTFQTTFSGIGADKMRTEYDMVTLVDGVETGNIRTWSVEGRVVEIRAGSNQLMTDVANALLTYGDSAAAYFAAQ